MYDWQTSSVVADLHLVAEAHLLLFVLIEGQPGEADDDQHHAEMDEVSAVTARVAARDLHHAVDDVGVLLAGDDASAAPELTR